jgi:hypothetical protein
MMGVVGLIDGETYERPCRGPRQKQGFEFDDTHPNLDSGKRLTARPVLGWGLMGRMDVKSGKNREV